MTGTTGDGSDNLGIFGGMRLSKLPFRLDLAFEDTAGGKIGSNCSGPDARSVSSDTAPSTAVLSIANYRYEFGKRGEYYAVAYRHTQGIAVSRLVEMHFRVLQGQNIRRNSADPTLTVLDVWAKPSADVPAPIASCDWREPMSITQFNPYESHSGFRITGGDNPGSEAATANLFLTSLTIHRTGVTEADNKPSPSAPPSVIDKNNLIIGLWTAKNKDSVRVPTDVEFTATEQIANGQRWPVKYSLDGNDITVIPKGTFPRTCTMKGFDAMVCHTQFGDFEMIRLK